MEFPFYHQKHGPKPPGKGQEVVYYINRNGKTMSKDENQEVVTTDELLMAQMIRLDAIAQLLIDKGLISEEEFYTKLQHVQAQYQKVSGG